MYRWALPALAHPFRGEGAGDWRHRRAGANEKERGWEVHHIAFQYRLGISARRGAEGSGAVGISAAADTPVSALTYIDQKRVELARALIADPKLLLLDEWLAGLNPTELQTGIALIDSLRAEGRTILIIEHVMDAIRSLCDTCVVMNSGQKIAEGSPGDVLADRAVIRAYLGDDNA